jgi:hypothetical protein
MIACSLPTVAVAQEEEEAKEPTFQHLPEPLEEVGADLKTIEQHGNFKIVAMEYGRTPDRRDQAIVWTLRVVRPITCRHALMQMRYYRDVRFFATDGGSRQELMHALLYYAPRIDAGAVNRDLMALGEEFPMWLLLRPGDIRRLTAMSVDVAEFRKWRKP